MPKQQQAASRSVCLIVGEDEFSVTEKARERIDGFVPPADQTLGLEIIDGQADIISKALNCLRRCLEAVRTVGFLSGRKVVWLRQADFLSNPVIQRNKDIQETLQVMAESLDGGIPDGHLLVVTARKIDARTSFYKACQRHGEIIEFKLAEKPWQRDSGATAFAKKAFQEAGLQIGAELTEVFTQKTGTDTRQIMQEIAKLATYLGNRREVQIGDIQEITSTSRALFAWDLEDAVARRDLHQALAVLRQLLFQREEPLRLIAGLETRFRHLLIFREALDNRWISVQPSGRDSFRIIMPKLPELVAEQFQQAMTSEKGTPLHPFVAGKLAGQASLFSRDEIDQRREWILASRRKLVSSSTPDFLILEYLVIKLCRSRSRPAQKAAS